MKTGKVKVTLLEPLWVFMSWEEKVSECDINRYRILMRARNHTNAIQLYAANMTEDLRLRFNSKK